MSKDIVGSNRDLKLISKVGSRSKVDLEFRSDGQPTNLTVIEMLFR